MTTTNTDRPVRVIAAMDLDAQPRTVLAMASTILTQRHTIAELEAELAARELDTIREYGHYYSGKTFEEARADYEYRYRCAPNLIVVNKEEYIEEAAPDGIEVRRGNAVQHGWLWIGRK